MPRDKKYICKICGYVFIGFAPPDKCPDCGVSAPEFEELTD
ncbi:MAG: rubredoxin-like domain-containing protein [Thermoguttaceae bacterium]|jgi:rubrerythrin